MIVDLSLLQVAKEIQGSLQPGEDAQVNPHLSLIVQALTFTSDHIAAWLYIT